MTVEKQSTERWEHPRLSISRYTTDLQRKTENTSMTHCQLVKIVIIIQAKGQKKEASQHSYPITSSSRLIRLLSRISPKSSEESVYGYTIGSLSLPSFTIRLVRSRAPNARKKPLKSPSSSVGCSRTTMIRVPCSRMGGKSAEQSRPSQPHAGVWQLRSQTSLL